MKKNSFLKMLLDLIYEFIDLKILHSKIKENEESRKVSTAIAKKSIKFSVVSIILTIIAGLCAFGGLKLLNSILIIFGILLIVCAILIFIYAIGYYILSLIAIIKQFTLNRKGSTIFALILNILLILVMVGTVLLVLSI